MYYETVKKAVKNYRKMVGHDPINIKMSQEFYDLLRKELDEKYPIMNTPQYHVERIFGIPIEIVDDDYY